MAGKSSSFNSREQLSVDAEAIASRFRQNRRQIRDYLNVDVLKSHLVERFVLEADDLRYLHDELTRKPVDYILDLVEERSLYLKFLESVRSETTHLGHEYIQALLQGTYYCRDDELHKSAGIRRKIESILPKMMDVNLPSLFPLLYSQCLLTNDEAELFIANPNVPNQNILQFFDILNTKGPLAYLKFVHCLSQEMSHPPHNQLYELLCQTTDEEELAVGIWGSPARRTPNRLVMEGVLVKEQYKRLFSTMKENLYNGNWVAVKQRVDGCIQSHIPELCVVGLLEEAASWVFHGDHNKVLMSIKTVKELCESRVSEANALFLVARAECIVSEMYRDIKQNDKALEHAEKAMLLLFNAELGEDHAYANYNHACALACTHNPSINAQQVINEFTLVVDQASYSVSKWSQIMANQSLIQLAVIFLKLSVPGTTDKTVQDSMERASSFLSRVNVSSLTNRTKCLYYLAKSDFCTHREDVDDAIRAATQALMLATDCGFASLQHSANANLVSIPGIIVGRSLKSDRGGIGTSNSWRARSR